MTCLSGILFIYRVHKILLMERFALILQNSYNYFNNIFDTSIVLSLELIIIFLLPNFQIFSNSVTDSKINFIHAKDFLFLYVLPYYQFLFILSSS